MNFRRAIAMAATVAVSLSVTLSGTVIATAEGSSVSGLEANISSAGPIFQWDEAIGASAYRLQVSTDPQFTPETIILQEDTYVTQWVPQTNLGGQHERTLYWRVAPFASNTTVSSLGEFSEVALIEFPALAAPTLVSPAHEASVEYPEAVTFTWDTVPGAVSYVLEYSTDVNFPSTAGVTVSKTTTATSFTPSTALSQQNYYWRVAANYQKPRGTSSQTNTVVQSAFSAAQKFSVTWPAAKSRPTLIAPADSTGNSSVVQDLTFAWTPVAGAKGYVLELSKTNTPFTPTRELTFNVTESIYVPKIQLSNESYFWRVRAVSNGTDAGIDGDYSDVWQISKKSTQSSAPVLSADDALNTSLQPTPTFGGESPAESVSVPYNELLLSWDPFPRATYYKVSVHPESRSGSVIECYTANTSTTVVTEITNLSNHAGRYAPNGTCLWPARAQDRLSAGESYSWQVEAIDLPASSGRAINASGEPTNVVKSNLSDRRFFTLTESTFTSSTEAPTIDQEALSQRYTVSPGEPFPLITWSGEHWGLADPDDEDAIQKLIGYEVTVFTGTRGNEISVAYTTQTHIQFPGVINDSTTQEEYEVVVSPVQARNTDLRAGQVLELSSGAESDPASWRKSTSRISGLNAEALDNGSVLLSWTPHYETGRLDGGSRGYEIIVYNSSGGVVSAAKTEYPFLVAQHPLTPETAEFRPLAPGNYTFQIFALDANGNRASGSGSESEPFTIELPAPAAPAVTELSGNSATLVWEPTTASDEYRVLLKRPGQTTFNQTFDSYQNATTLTDLAPGTYEWKVISLRGSGSSAIQSQESEVVAFTISAATPFLSTKTGIEFGVSDRLLVWEPVENATRYLVEIAENSSMTSALRVYETVNTSFAPPLNYTSDKTYYWRVRPVADKVSTSTSNRQALSTSDANRFTVVTTPGVVNPATPKLQGRQLSLTWPALTGAARGSLTEPLVYIVQYRELTNDDDWGGAVTIETSADATSYSTPANLAPDTTYQFRVAAQNSQGIGAWSKIVTGKTAGVPSTSTSRITATAGIGKATVTWQEVRGTTTNPITGYQVRYQEVGKSSWTVRNLGPTARSVNLNGLRTLANYYVEVAAVNSYGVGPFGRTQFYVAANALTNNTYEQIIPTPDVTGDKYGDLLAVDNSGNLWLFTGSASGAIGTGKKLPRSWTGLTVSAPGDFDRDGKADILAKNQKGELYFFAGDGKGGFANGVRVGHGWGPYDIIPAGDVTGDGVADVLAIKQDTGELFYYAGNGRGGFTGKLTKNGQGWLGVNLYPAGDLNGDGKSDILSVRADGTLHSHYGRGDGGFRKSFQSGQGWGAYELFAGSDGNADRQADLYGRSPAGDLYYYAGKPGGFRAALKIGSKW